MMKRILSILLVLVMCFAFSVTAFADNSAERLVDGADLLTDDEEIALAISMSSVIEKYQVDLVIVTVPGLEGNTPEEFANSYYDSNNYGIGSGRDGILLLVSMEYRDYYILTNGLGYNALDSGEIESLGETVANSLGAEDYVTAFNDFIDECEYQINGEINGFPFDFGKSFIISLVIGLILAFIVTGNMKSKLKSVQKQVGATEYTKPGSLQVTFSNDFFLYRTVDRRQKESKSSSSSGSSRGGGGGKF